jgi:gamma-glutamyltranspeptidase/glutathione hydrolase
VSSRGSQSWVVEGHPSSVASGKRPRLTPCPAIVFKHGQPFMPLGTPGGDVQRQAMLQVFLNVAVFGMAPPGGHRGTAFCDLQLSRLVRAARVPRGRAAHRARPRGRSRRRHGRPGPRGRDLAIDHARGVLAAGADPRRMGYAIGW